MAFDVPAQLAAICRKTPERAAWLIRLPSTVRHLERRWSLEVGTPFVNEGVTCAWVAPVALASGRLGVLKVGMPHIEPDHEIQGLRFWNGDPTVRLLKAADELGAMLLERCITTDPPGIRTGFSHRKPAASHLALATRRSRVSAPVGL